MVLQLVYVYQASSSYSHLKKIGQLIPPIA